MALIDLFFERAVARGPLTVIHPDGSRRVFGEPDPALRPVTIRLAPGAGAAIARAPGLAAAECFMDGRITIENGDILDLLMLVRANNDWEKGSGHLRDGPFRRILDGSLH